MALATAAAPVMPGWTIPCAPAECAGSGHHQFTSWWPSSGQGAGDQGRRIGLSVTERPRRPAAVMQAYHRLAKVNYGLGRPKTGSPAGNWLLFKNQAISLKKLFASDSVYFRKARRRDEKVAALCLLRRVPGCHDFERT